MGKKVLVNLNMDEDLKKDLKKYAGILELH